MATAVKNPSDLPAAPVPHEAPQAHLLRGSVVGALYVTLCLGLVFFGIPLLWKASVGPLLAKNLGAFFDPAGMAVALIAAAVGLLLLGARLAGTSPPPGLRAGVFTFVAGGLLVFLATIMIGRLLNSYVFKSPSSMPGLLLMLAAGIAIVVLIVKYTLGHRFGHYMASFESQGWFSIRTYKPTQGKLVRRLTMLGILGLVGSGVYSLVTNSSLKGAWQIRIPFTQDLFLADHRLVATLLPDIAYTVPALLIALGLWVGWRAVNYPAFADFLIATEAELNKISWVPRKRLVQDTIVVLVTLLLFTMFLLFIDQLWGWLLTRETLGGIVPKPVPKEQTDEFRDASW